MKIAISNIAWEHKYLSEYLKLLKQLGCSGVEIAPSIIWTEPTNSSIEDRKIFKDQIHKEGLEIIGFHALLFSRPDYQSIKIIFVDIFVDIKHDDDTYGSKQD